MGWVSEKAKAILLEHGPQFFSKKGPDREDYVHEIVELLKAIKDEDLPESGVGYHIFCQRMHTLTHHA